METPDSPPPLTSHGDRLGEALEKLRHHDAFRDLVTEMEAVRDEQFRALKGQKKRMIHQIAGAVSILDDLIALFKG